MSEIDPKSAHMDRVADVASAYFSNNTVSPNEVNYVLLSIDAGLKGELLKIDGATEPQAPVQAPKAKVKPTKPAKKVSEKATKTETVATEPATEEKPKAKKAKADAKQDDTKATEEKTVTKGISKDGVKLRSTSDPAVEIKKSVTDDFIICLEDGARLKMMKRYLKTHFGMTPEQYRARWNLPESYPMVAPNYAKQRSAIAKQVGLGKNPEDVQKSA